MFARSALLAILFFTQTVFAAEPKAISTFDIYAAPFIGSSYGSHKADDADEGTNLSFHIGARVGFKLGPLLLGGEFASGSYTGWNSKTTTSVADQAKYSTSSSGTLVAAGLNVGLLFDRVALWTSYYPVYQANLKYNQGAGSYENLYDGKTYSTEINFRVWERLYLGACFTHTEYSKYSNKYPSAVVTDAALDPKLSVFSYGLTVSYLIPFSELGNISKYFPTL